MVTRLAVPDHREQDFGPTVAKLRDGERRGAFKVPDDAEQASQGKAVHKLLGTFPSSGKQKPWLKTMHKLFIRDFLGTYQFINQFIHQSNTK